MTISLQQFCLLLFEPKILRGKYPAMFVSENKTFTVNTQYIQVNLKQIRIPEFSLFLFLLLSLELTGLVFHTTLSKTKNFFLKVWGLTDL
jgi:hypothetical protein